jgi:hypothetical protein
VPEALAVPIPQAQLFLPLLFEGRPVRISGWLGRVRFRDDADFTDVLTELRLSIAEHTSEVELRLATPLWALEVRDEPGAVRLSIDNNGEFHASFGPADVSIVLAPEPLDAVAETLKVADEN